MSHPDRFATPGGLSRNTVIVGSVVALHVAGLWALQSGLLRKAAEVIVPAELLTEFIAPPAPPKIELPSSQASYLNNAPPRYPSMSKRLGEQGRVVIRALIATDGTASQATIRTSSGYLRLDETALKTVLQWRYVPGKRAGVPEAMWFNIPLDFVLE